MSLNGQTSDGGAGGLATARYDRGPAGATAADNLIAIARQFRLAMIFKIPVGYQDEKGFHRGQPRVQKSIPIYQPEYVKKGEYQF